MWSRLLDEPGRGIGIRSPDTCRCARRFSAQQIRWCSRQRGRAWPCDTELIADALHPRAIKASLTASARRSPRRRLYSSEPHSSVCPSTRILTGAIRLSRATLAFSARSPSGLIRALSKSKRTSSSSARSTNCSIDACTIARLGAGGARFSGRPTPTNSTRLPAAMVAAQSRLPTDLPRELVPWGLLSHRPLTHTACQRAISAPDFRYRVFTARGDPCATAKIAVGVPGLGD